MVTLNQDELKRYSRQMLMEGWGEAGQLRLKRSTAFVAGAGGLGSPVCLYLAVAGVGRIVVCDSDSPDLTNLNRQILHDHTRVGTNKAVSARMTLDRQNPHVEVVSVTEHIAADNVERLTAGADILLDCLDNFPTRFLLNRVAVARGIPLVHGSVWGMDGRLAFFHPPSTPCLECLYAESPPKEVFPVAGAVPGVIGSLQALEAVKYLAGVGSGLKDRLLTWEGARGAFRTLPLRKDPSCAACGSRLGKEEAA